MEAINEKLENVDSSVGHRVHSQSIYTIAQKKGLTRNCTNPWSYFMIGADSSVYACCIGQNIGKLGEDSLDTILNGKTVQKLRRRLLTGDLDRKCKFCHNIGWITKKELLKKVVNQI
jgi:radical SAM protein with 4Fe4S-binding SPASM domain